MCTCLPVYLYTSSCLTLFHSLLKQDIGHLRIIAELWGLELNSQIASGTGEAVRFSPRTGACWPS